MIGIEFINGQGLGNQLLSYVSVKALAKKYGYEFGTASQDNFAMNIHNDKGMYFMDVDLGLEITEADKEKMEVFHEKEDRFYSSAGIHDSKHGCYIAGADSDLLNNLKDNTVIYGNLQDQSYFIEYKDGLKDWLKIKSEYDTYEYSRDNLCIINIRGGEYEDNPELYLSKKYYLAAIKVMKKLVPDMEFMIVTDDVKAANRLFPNIEAHHFDIAKDYAILKNAKYLILSNSSFAILPVHTSECLIKAVAPKYWARHNVSNGYWASEQNVYDALEYIDRKGKLFTAEECRKELEAFKANSAVYKKLNVKPEGMKLKALGLIARLRYIKHRIIRKAKRAIFKLTHE